MFYAGYTLCSAVSQIGPQKSLLVSCYHNSNVNYLQRVPVVPRQASLAVRARRVVLARTALTVHCNLNHLSIMYSQQKRLCVPPQDNDFEPEAHRCKIEESNNILSIHTISICEVLNTSQYYISSIYIHDVMKFFF